MIAIFVVGMGFAFLIQGSLHFTNDINHAELFATDSIARDTLEAHGLVGLDFQLVRIEFLS